MKTSALNLKNDQNFVVGQWNIWNSQLALAAMGPQLQINSKIQMDG